MNVTLLTAQDLRQTSASAGIPLGRFDCERRPALTLEARLGQLLGVSAAQWRGMQARQDVPAANGPLLRLRPLAVEVGLSCARAQPDVCLTPDETAAQAATLAPWLADEGIRLYTPHPQRWYLELPAAAAAEFAEFDAMAPLLGAQTISGPQAAAWRRRLTELQMLLAAHPVNQAREARQLPGINLLWAEHCAPDWPALAPFTIWAPAEYLPALPAPIVCRARPAGWSELTLSAGQQLLVMDDLPLETQLTRWLQPAITARQRGQLSALQLECLLPTQCYRFTIGRWHRYRFWKSAVFHD